jgi:uncharacterized membrane protein YfcA
MDMWMEPWVWSLLVTLMMGVIALLYASVGHAGASGYLAIMALVGIAPAVMKPSALALNILVSLIAVYQFYRAGAFSWRIFLPLAVTSIPFAFLGGTMTLPAHWYKPMIGVVLIYAVLYSWMRSFKTTQPEPKVVSPLILAIVGAVLGLLSGLTGVGGGIFLSPLLLRMNWAPVRVISGVAAMFILVNSISGLLGVLSHQPRLSPDLPYWALAVVIGGFIGAHLGSRRLNVPMIQRFLSVVLLISGLKMLLT